MLVFLVAATIIGSFLLEIVLHHLANHYEIEWIFPFRRPEKDMAQEILASLRKSAANLNAR
jgi:hypothetical protein